ncbi:MAG: NAD-dependent epimerase/dehydratase family protein, partial [Myxococcales bacterium]|nr:NAD-dependent epimerase/dehydratase family protein [Myxococcales bacterium]
MRILVTGGTGFIGSHVVTELIAAGHTPRLLVRSEAKMRRVFEPRGVATEDFVVGDVTDPVSVKAALDGCDAVVHAAATVSIEGTRASEVQDTNFRGTELVVGGAAEAGFRAIHYVSSLTAILDPDAETIEPDSPVIAAESAYGRSKAQAEEFVRALRDRGAPISIFYPSGVLGPGDPGLAESMRGLAAVMTMCVFRTTGGWLAVDVRDVASSIRAVLDADATGGFITAGHFLGWEALADLVEGISGHRVRRITVPPRWLRALGRGSDLVKRVIPFDLPITRESMELVTLMPPVPNSPELEALGVHFRDPAETHRDAIRAIVEDGHVPEK